jgi:hypothetical protein
VGENFILLFFVIVVGIPVLLGVGGDVIKRWIKMKERELELASARAAERDTQSGALAERLEQRVRVLERIVTDRGYDVATQIEALRDQRRVEELLDAPADRSLG